MTNDRQAYTDDPSDAIARCLAMIPIAVVGASDEPDRPSYGVVRTMLRLRLAVIPVNPKYDTVLGMKCYRTMAEVGKPIGLVNVFRRASLCPDVARQAVEVGAKGLWLQSGIVSDEARAIAEAAGLVYVENACLGVLHAMRR